MNIKHIEPFLKSDIDIEALELALNDVVIDTLEKKWIDKQYQIQNQSDVVDYYRTMTSRQDIESAYCIYLDIKNRVIKHTKESDGTLTQSLVYIREIAKKALMCSAGAIILIHNHPSGDVNPSDADKKITKKLFFACKNLDISLLDHLIIGGNNYYSFNAAGLLSEYNSAYKLIYA